jgi:hypothetical protein
MFGTIAYSEPEPEPARNVALSDAAAGEQPATL